LNYRGESDNSPDGTLTRKIDSCYCVRTDLFEIIISAGYGTLTHAVKGNVDIMVALVMHTGAAIGAQIGATLTEYFHGPWIRLAFAPLPLIGAGLVIYSLVTGHHF
jgi:uncharacterized membrane protein YfcA